MKIYEIVGKMEGNWNSEVRAMIDTWKSYSLLTLEEFKKAVFVKGIEYAKANKGQAWIVDSSAASGVFSQEIQKYIGEKGFPMFVEKGITYFITINSEVSPMTKMTVNRYKANALGSGLQQIELNNVADAIQWLKVNAK